MKLRDGEKHVIETNQQSLLFPFRMMLQKNLHRNISYTQLVSCPESDSTQ